MATLKRDASPWITRFGEDTAGCHSALLNLRSIMLRVGFIVDQKREKEATLRAYVRQRLTYPLLNPRFVSRESRALLEFTVLSKLTRPTGFDDALDGHLRRWTPTPNLAFKPCGETLGTYYVHGAFLLPLFLQDGVDDLALDLHALEPTLRGLLDYLDQPRPR